MNKWTIETLLHVNDPGSDLQPGISESESCEILKLSPFYTDDWYTLRWQVLRLSMIVGYNVAAFD